jgi:hypothetical protein
MSINNHFALLTFQLNVNKNLPSQIDKALFFGKKTIIDENYDVNGSPPPRRGISNQMIRESITNLMCPLKEWVKVFSQPRVEPAKV